MSARKPMAPRPAETGISVLVAEEHGAVRDGLGELLARHHDIRVVAAVADGAAAAQEAARHLPTVAILGVAIAGLNSVEVTRLIAEKAPEVAVLVLSLQSSPAAVRRALDAGASGYLSRQSGGAELLVAVRAIAAGKRYLGQGLSDGTGGGAPGGQPVEVLTATERNILRLVADGLSNPRVAEELGLSRRTVETYRLRLMRKLGIDDLPTLVKYAIRSGIVTLD